MNVNLVHYKTVQYTSYFIYWLNFGVKVAHSYTLTTHPLRSPHSPRSWTRGYGSNFNCFWYLWPFYANLSQKKHEKLNSGRVPKMKPSELKIKFLSAWIAITTDFRKIEFHLFFLSKIGISKKINLDKNRFKDSLFPMTAI